MPHGERAGDVNLDFLGGPSDPTVWSANGVSVSDLIDSRTHMG